jgi:hypothetical protein
VGQLEKGIGADRATTERLLLAIGARKSDPAEEWWTLTPISVAPPKNEGTAVEV